MFENVPAHGNQVNLSVLGVLANVVALRGSPEICRLQLGSSVSGHAKTRIELQDHARWPIPRMRRMMRPGGEHATMSGQLGTANWVRHAAMPRGGVRGCLEDHLAIQIADVEPSIPKRRVSREAHVVVPENCHRRATVVHASKTKLQFTVATSVGNLCLSQNLASDSEGAENCRFSRAPEPLCA